MTPAFWSTLSCFTTTNEEPTSRKGGPARSPSTSSAPFRNTGGNVWWELPSPRFWWPSRDQLMVGTPSISFRLLKLLRTWPGTFLRTGVKVRKGTEEVEVRAPVVISNCGVFTTFQTLLPPEIKVRPGETHPLQMTDPSTRFKLVTNPLVLIKTFRKDSTWWNMAEGHS